MPLGPVSGDVDEKMAPIAPEASAIRMASRELVTTAAYVVSGYHLREPAGLAFSGKGEKQGREVNGYLLATRSPLPTPAFRSALA